MNSISRNAYFLCLAVILLAAIWYPKWNKGGTEATISWDVSGYYLYLPAVFIYQDVKELEFLPEIIEQYRPSPHPDQAFQHESGNQVMKYPLGWSILYLPFFLIAHLIALLTNYPADGFSTPYQWGIGWGSILVAFIGLWVCRKILLQYFSDRATALSLVLIAIGSNYLNYSAIDGALTHNYLFTLYALLIYLSIRFYESPSNRKAIWIGLVVGLLTLTRPTELIAVILPLGWGIGSWADLKARLQFWIAHGRMLLLSISALILVGSLQLIYWKYVSGDWLVYSYQEQGFSWLNPHIENVFFSYRKGWLVYTPLISFALLGFVFLWQQKRSIFWATLLFFLVNTWIVTAWDIWWYGGSFGQRAMIQSYAVLAFPLAAFFQWLRGKRITSIFVSVLLLAGILLNLFQTGQAHNGTLHPEFMTRAYYWRIFGKWEAAPRDEFLLDTKEDFRGPRKDVQVIYEQDFEGFFEEPMIDTLEAKSGLRSVHLNKEQEFSPSIKIPTTQLPDYAEWIRISGQFLFHQKEGAKWRYPQMVCLLEHEGAVRKNRMIRPKRLLHPGYWQAEYMDLSIPAYPIDTIHVYVWLGSGQYDFFVDDIKVEAYAE